MANRFMVAPMTNTQSNGDGTLSDDEFRWLTMRAAGGFGSVMTCATHVQPNGQGWPGELGSFSDSHGPGLSQLSQSIHSHGSQALVQLFHGGLRAKPELFGETQTISASENSMGNARAMTLGEIDQLVENFAAAAQRCEKAGFDGVEIHGAHGYLLCQFLSPEYNHRSDEYGGSLGNRVRLINRIIDAIRSRTGSEFIVGLRLSPEGNGLDFGEMHQLSEEFLKDPRLDFLDISLWDCFKLPDDPAYGAKDLLGWYADLERSSVRLGVAGKIYSSADAQKVLDRGADFALIGKGAILHHDFANRALEDPSFAMETTPVTPEYLAKEGLGPAFIAYMRRWDGFVAD